VLHFSADAMELKFAVMLHVAFILELEACVVCLSDRLSTVHQHYIAVSVRYCCVWACTFCCQWRWQNTCPPLSWVVMCRAKPNPHL